MKVFKECTHFPIATSNLLCPKQSHLSSGIDVRFKSLTRYKYLCIYKAHHDEAEAEAEAEADADAMLSIIILNFRGLVEVLRVCATLLIVTTILCIWVSP